MDTNKLSEEVIQEFLSVTKTSLSYANLCLLKDSIQHVLIKSNEWIPISERLPEKQGHYLVRCPKSFPKNYRGVIAEFYEDNQSFYGEYSEEVHEDVTHWMELPDAD